METKRLVRAFQYAAELHKDQLRKGTSIPYISHLMAVAGMVLEHGGDEDQVIAALLHDAIEDHPEHGQTREQIQQGFGARVLAMVEECSDSETDPKPAWRERKERYIARLSKAPREAKLISLADKVHNARAIVSDHKLFGDEVWKRFKGAKEGTLWYYRALADTFLREYPGPLARELDRVVNEMEQLAKQG